MDFDLILATGLYFEYFYYYSLFGQWLQKIYFEEGMLSIITQKKLFYYVERFPQINPRKAASIFYVDSLGGRGGQKNAYFTK